MSPAPDLPLREALAELGRPLRIVVTGGRDFKDIRLLWWALSGLHNAHGVARLAHGNCSGADRMAAGWAAMCKVPAVPYDADWNRYGKPAGPIRNRRMLTAEAPDLLVAFPGNRGTADCIASALALSVPVWRVAA